jgi:hypothetical protein
MVCALKGLTQKLLKKATLLLYWIHHYNKYTFVITKWLTGAKYPYLKWHWIFDLWRRFIPSSITMVTWWMSYNHQPLPDLTTWVTRWMSYNHQPLLDLTTWVTRWMSYNHQPLQDLTTWVTRWMSYNHQPLLDLTTWVTRGCLIITNLYWTWLHE